MLKTGMNTLIKFFTLLDVTLNRFLVDWRNILYLSRSSKFRSDIKNQRAS